MPISAPGSKRQRGFTLIELLVVLALIALATATVGLALRDPNQDQLQREAERLIALLETARAEARASGLEVRWRPQGGGGDTQFQFLGLPKRIVLPTRWLGDAPSVELEREASELLLGPEPLLPPQGLRLRLGQQQLRIASDGLTPFAIQAQPQP